MTAKLNRRIKAIDFIVAVEANVFFGWHLFVVEERISGQVEPKSFVQLVFSSFDGSVSQKLPIQLSGQVRVPHVINLRNTSQGYFGAIDYDVILKNIEALMNFLGRKNSKQGMEIN